VPLGDVQLHDLASGDGARVRHGDAQLGVARAGARRQGDLAVGEGRVAEAVAEGEEHVARVARPREVAVAHVEPVVVDDLAHVPEGPRRRVRRGGLGEGLREFAARVRGAEEEVRERGAARFAREVHLQDGRDVADPGHGDGRPVLEHDDDVAPRRRDGRDERVLVRRQVQTEAVVALRLVPER